MATDISKIRPMPGWALCEALKPAEETGGGLVMVRPGVGLEEGKTGEGVAIVHAVSPQLKEDGGEVDPGFEAGDRILIRDYLKFANPIGEILGADKPYRFFLLSNRDAVAVVSGKGTLGHYNEFVLE